MSSSDWAFHRPKPEGGYHEAWFFKLNDPATGRAALIRFTLLVTENGFQKSADTWAIFYERTGSDTAKTALRKSHELSEFRHDAQGLGIGASELSDSGSRGEVTTRAGSIAWDLRMEGDRTRFDYVPAALKRAKLVRNQALTLREAPLFSGTITVNGREHRFERAPGMLGHHCGPAHGLEWTWAHCSSFINEKGEPVGAVFDAITGRARLGRRLAAPPMTAMLFQYAGQRHEFSTLRDLFRLRLRSSLTEWDFRAERGPLALRGLVRTNTRDFAGLSMEDTDGAILHVCTSLMADFTLLVYRDGRVVDTLQAKGTSAYEVGSRKTNPFVPDLI